MTVGVCIVSYQRAALTRRCIESVRVAATLPYRIFLVDNGSPDCETRSLLTDMGGSGDVSLTRLERNLGPAAARNLVIRTLSGEVRYVAMFDNDIVALPGWDEAARKALDAGADLIQPKLLKADGHTLERGPNRPNASALAANPQFVGSGLPVDHPEVNREEEAAIVGGTGVFRREVFDRIGLLDERLHVGEDFEFSFRARAAGFSLRYAPNCALIHDHGFDLAYDQERARTAKYLTSHVVLWRKWRKALLSPAYLAWYDWLDRNGEPMYLPADQRWRIAHRRLRRRLARRWIMARYANDWDTPEAADWAAEALAVRLGVA